MTGKRTRPTKKWLRAHFKTTPGMDVPDYVICNRLSDAVEREAARYVAENPRMYDRPELAAGAAVRLMMSTISGITDIPGVTEFLHKATSRVGVWPPGGDASPAGGVKLSQTDSSSAADSHEQVVEQQRSEPISPPSDAQSVRPDGGEG